MTESDKFSAVGESWDYCSAVTRDGWRWIVDQQDILGTKIAQQQKQIESLSATVQKVSEKLELTKAPQLVTNP